MPSPLSVDAIRSLLSTRLLGQRLEVIGATESTNRDAVSLAQAGAGHGTVVVADEQTAGRGRLGRAWFSPPAVNLYCSIVVRHAVPVDRLSEWLSWLPLAAALAGAEAIESVAGIPVGVKWPNDILVAERKVGGILCESGASPGLGSFQVIGIGVNVNGSPSELPADIREAATTLAHEAGREFDRNELVSRLLQELEVCLEELCARGYQRILLGYSMRCVTLGRQVRASLSGGKEVFGLAQSIGVDGSLQLVERESSEAVVRKPLSLRVADIVHLRAGESIA